MLTNDINNDIIRIWTIEESFGNKALFFRLKGVEGKCLLLD
jgi:hypothetical protein